MNDDYDPNAPLYLSTIETVELSPVEFASKISQLENGPMYMTDGKLIRFEKKFRTRKFPPILMSEEVFKGFKSANPERNSVKNNHFNLINDHNIRNVTSKVYGCDLVWKI
ncbi:MAG: hypothetical protein EOO43_23865 [Flavobacterium sp.]|nr:MAG: hypothetical protein EOO43_23865 [Flavobacterium sp.]